MCHLTGIHDPDTTDQRQDRCRTWSCGLPWASVAARVLKLPSAIAGVGGGAPLLPLYTAMSGPRAVVPVLPLTYRLPRSLAIRDTQCCNPTVTRDTGTFLAQIIPVMALALGIELRAFATKIDADRHEEGRPTAPNAARPTTSQHTSACSSQ